MVSTPFYLIGPIFKSWCGDQLVVLFCGFLQALQTNAEWYLRFFHVLSNSLIANCPAFQCYCNVYHVLEQL